MNVNSPNSPLNFCYLNLLKDAEVEEEISLQDDDSDREDKDQTSSAVQQTTHHEEEDENAEASLFPDTSIDLQLTREGK